MVGEHLILLPDEAEPDIVVVIDEIGPFPLLIRALCTRVGVFGASLYKALTKKSGGTVQFILSGTDASYATHDVATTPGTYELLLLDPIATVQTTALCE